LVVEQLVMSGFDLSRPQFAPVQPNLIRHELIWRHCGQVSVRDQSFLPLLVRVGIETRKNSALQKLKNGRELIIQIINRVVIKSIPIYRIFI
jgi:hypothetical protein